MAQEVNARVGHLLTLPDGTSDENLMALRRDLASIEGGVSLVETTSAGHGQGMRSAPQVRLAAKAIRGAGARIEHSSPLGTSHWTSSRRWAFPLLSTTERTACRQGEAYRLLLVTTLQPIAELIVGELSRKLETTVEIGFRRLHTADIQSRARAFGTMIAAGVDEETAMEVSGLTA